MNARLRVICTHETALGFALSGIAPIEAESGEELVRALEVLEGTPARGGLIFVEAKLHDALPLHKRRQLRREGMPILMPFPSPSTDRGVAPEHELLEVLRRAVGYRVRLR